MLELGIIRLLISQTKSSSELETKEISKAIYMAPTKALCGERFIDWTKKFNPLGIKCMELTGDSEVSELRDIADAHIILTTPVCIITIFYIDN